jgi:hypothetical protein
MSLLLFLFYWIAIPVLMIAVAAWLWRRVNSPAARGLIVVACLATLSGLLWLAVGEKWLADRQVRELCAKDGGVRVYETVTLPAERFDKWGNLGIRDKKYAKPTDEYYYESEVHYYRRGNPTLLRSRSQVVRRSDGKVLGEAVSYGRGGGDLPGPWHGSSFHCPPIADAEGKIESSIFLKGNEK